MQLRPRRGDAAAGRDSRARDAAVRCPRQRGQASPAGATARRRRRPVGATATPPARHRRRRAPATRRPPPRPRSRRPTPSPTLHLQVDARRRRVRLRRSPPPSSPAPVPSATSTTTAPPTPLATESASATAAPTGGANTGGGGSIGGGGSNIPLAVGGGLVRSLGRSRLVRSSRSRREHGRLDALSQPPEQANLQAGGPSAPPSPPSWCARAVPLLPRLAILTALPPTPGDLHPGFGQDHRTQAHQGPAGQAAGLFDPGQHPCPVDRG